MKGTSLRSTTGCILLLAMTGGFAGMSVAQATGPLYSDARGIAVQGDYWAMYRYLAMGGIPDVVDATGQTPLITSALAGDLGMVALLIDEGADIGKRTDNGLTALHAAAFVGAADVAAELIRAGADVNDQANWFGITPLHPAAEENRAGVIAVLLAAGADPTKIDSSKFTATSRAGWREYWDVFAVLVKAGSGCQTAEIAGAWLYEKCLTFPAPADANTRRNGMKTIRPSATRSLLIAAALQLVALPLWAGNEAQGFVNTGYFGTVAIRGYDPVAYFTEGKPVPGNPAVAYSWLGADWYFASEDHKALFIADPVAYAPQYGGLCADGVAYDTATTSIDPNAWRIIDGKLYLNYDTISAAEFEETAGFVAKADENWATMRNTLP